MSRLESALADLRLADTLAARDTPLARLDPRAKLVTTAAFLVAVVSYDRYAFAALFPFLLYPVALVSMGEVPWRWLAGKLAIAAPFAILVGIANPFLDVAPREFMPGVAVAGGWVSFGSILLRFVLTVSAALAVIAGTGMHSLCAGLAAFGTPRVLTAQLLFLWRYAFVLGGEGSRMVTAREARGARGAPSITEYGSLAGHWLLRAFERAERIHLAMRARGFDGRFRPLRTLRWTAADTAFTLGWIAFFALARAVYLPELLGRLLTEGRP